MKATQKLLILILSIVFIHCSKDEPSAVTPDRDKFLATYSCTEACPSGNSNYEISISTSAESTSTVLISNFGNLANASVKATASGNTLSIPNQIINIQGLSITINSGSGALNGNILTISYGYSFNNQTESCTVTGTKK